jgi:hypothetical protein
MKKRFKAVNNFTGDPRRMAVLRTSAAERRSFQFDEN